MSNEQIKNKEDKIIEILEEMLKWVKIIGLQQVKNLLSELLSTDEKKIVYYYSDGRTSREISKLTGISHATITNWWKIWVKAGIAESVKVKGGGERAKRIFLLQDFGIDIPPTEGNKTEKEGAEKNHIK
ncbi:MAG: hypothetical protein QXY76_06875 [Nitrososphaeria archaeon]